MLPSLFSWLKTKMKGCAKVHGTFCKGQQGKNTEPIHTVTATVHLKNTTDRQSSFLHCFTERVHNHLPGVKFENSISFPECPGRQLCSQRAGAQAGLQAPREHFLWGPAHFGDRWYIAIPVAFRIQSTNCYSPIWHLHAGKSRYFPHIRENKSMSEDVLHVQPLWGPQHFAVAWQWVSIHLQFSLKQMIKFYITNNRWIQKSCSIVI